MTNWLSRLLRYAGLLFAAYWVVLFIGTHMPQPERVIPPVQQIDKVLHLVGYAGLAFLAAAATRVKKQSHLPWSTLGLIWLGLGAYAAFDEATQMLPFVRRHADKIDWLADFIGAALGLGVYAIAASWARRRGLRVEMLRAKRESS